MSLVIYSARTGRIRRIILDENLTDAQLEIKFPAETGEAAELGMPDILENLEAWQAEITSRTGLIPINDRYVVVDPNNDYQVESYYILDPDCGDSIENRLLVANANAEIGYRYMLDNSFQRSVKHINFDISAFNSLITMYVGVGWRNRMLATGMTNSEVNVERTRLTTEAQDFIIQFESELNIREGVR